MRPRETIPKVNDQLTVRLLSLLRNHLKLGCAFMMCTYVYGQQAPPSGGAPANPQVTGSASSSQPPDKRAYGLLPNYRTADASRQYKPIGAKQKMEIAVNDSFDWSLSVFAAGIGGLGQLTNQNPALGQGLEGYANRCVRVYADQVIGNTLTEGVMPILLHEDPRYFRLGQGTFWHRVGYATSRVVITKTDSGAKRFNYSEFLGNFIAVGISNAYYPGSRNSGANLNKFTVQVATDAFSNVLKEFWPDVKRKLPLSRSRN